MASASACKRSSSSSLLCKDPGLIAEFSCTGTKSCNGGNSVQRDLEALSLSRCLARNVSQKSMRKKKDGRHASSGRCVSRLYAKGGVCRVCACSDFGANCQTRLAGAPEDCLPQRSDLEVEGTGIECFSYGMPERFWRKNSSSAKEVEHVSSSSAAGISLPDDVLEMILVRLPFATLLTARRACKKWRSLTSTPHFMQMRSEGGHQSPWLFLVGIMRDGCHTGGDIHALDVSVDRWHRISHEALRGRFSFSVASIRTDIYIIGGCSAFADLSLSLERGPVKTHKGVLVFDPLTGSWHEASPMNSARSGAIMGVFEVGLTCSIFCRRPDRHDLSRRKHRIGGVSDVYEDPHRFSVRRQLKYAFNEDDDAPEPKRRPVKFVRQGGDIHKKFALIAVGGRGSWDEPLDSGEVYDPSTDRWVEIATLPADFGAVCSGTVCSGKFYVYSEVDKLAAYDLERGYWVLIQTTRPSPRLREYYPKLVSCKGRLFMLCVSWCDRNAQVNRREKAVRKLWELDLGLHAWKERSRHPDAPMDWNATFVADSNMIYGAEMFKIFGQALDFLTVCDVSEAEFKWRRISKKHATLEANVSSCMAKSMVVLHL